MEILINPNLAYILLVAGVLLTILAIITPGTGLVEIGALFLVLLAAWQVYNLPINLWAMLLLVLGVFPFLIALRKSRRLLYLVIAIAAFVLGSSFMFRGDAWWKPAVNPFLALIVSILSSGYIWIGMRKVLDAEAKDPEHDLSKLVGSVGETRTEINPEGSVQVAGELWTARSKQVIPEGAPIKVLDREGFVLIVAPLEDK